MAILPTLSGNLPDNYYNCILLIARESISTHRYCRQNAGGGGQNARVPNSICGAEKGAMSAQEFRDAHTPLSFKLHFRERKRAFASGND